MFYLKYRERFCTRTHHGLVELFYLGSSWGSSFEVEFRCSCFDDNLSVSWFGEKWVRKAFSGSMSIQMIFYQVFTKIISCRKFIVSAASFGCRTLINSSLLRVLHSSLCNGAFDLSAWIRFSKQKLSLLKYSNREVFDGIIAKSCVF